MLGIITVYFLNTDYITVCLKLDSFSNLIIVQLNLCILLIITDCEILVKVQKGI